MYLNSRSHPPKTGETAELTHPPPFCVTTGRRHARRRFRMVRPAAGARFPGAENPTAPTLRRRRAVARPERAGGPHPGAAAARVDGQGRRERDGPVRVPDRAESARASGKENTRSPRRSVLF